jgi:Ala-tRNA(Pro) deacylase
MTCKERLETYLRDNKVAYQLQHHPLAYTAQGVAESEHIPGRLVAKTVMVMADQKINMLVLPAPERVDLDRVRAALGAKEVRLAEEKEFAELFPDCEVGAMPPFGNLYGLPVFVDQDLPANDVIVFRAGTHTDTISLPYKEFERLVKPAIADLGSIERHAY